MGGGERRRRGLMNLDDLLLRTATGVAALLRDRAVSSRELTEAALRRIERLDPLVTPSLSRAPTRPWRMPAEPTPRWPPALPVRCWASRSRSRRPSTSQRCRRRGGTRRRRPRRHE
jgi:hypothetical protein